MKNAHDVINKIVSEELEIEVTENLELFANGLDSLKTLRVLSFVEEELGIEIPDEELIMENFATINALLNMVNKYV